MGLIRTSHPGHVAAQRHDVANAGIPITLHDLVDLAFRGTDTGQMRRGLERGFFDDALDGGVGAFPRRTARAISDRDEGWPKRLQPLDRSPQKGFSLLPLGRRKFETDPKPVSPFPIRVRT